MNATPAHESVRLRQERVRREARLAKLEYHCQVLRSRLARVAARAQRAPSDPSLARDLERWSMAVTALEKRCAREAAALRPVIEQRSAAAEQPRGEDESPPPDVGAQRRFPWPLFSPEILMQAEPS